MLDLWVAELVRSLPSEPAVCVVSSAEERLLVEKSIVSLLGSTQLPRYPIRVVRGLLQVQMLCTEARGECRRPVRVLRSWFKSPDDGTLKAMISCLGSELWTLHEPHSMDKNQPGWKT